MFSFLIFLLFIYLLRTIFFAIGSVNQRKFKFSSNITLNYKFISVIIPARNEEQNIVSCISSISNNNYPNNMYEIIVVNDRSTDRTGFLLNSLLDKIENLKIINIDDEIAEINLFGKTGALQAAIDIAKGEIVLMTDADCIAPEHWIYTTMCYFSKYDIGLLPSFIHVKGEKIFDKLQSLEWIYLNTMGSAGVGLGAHVGCFGNNLSFRKSDMDLIGGYRKIEFSVTEDLALLNAMYKINKKVLYPVNCNNIIDTKPCLTLSEYFRQHQRWAKGGLSLGWKAFSFVFSSFCLWIAFILSIIQGEFLFSILIIGFRAILDSLLLLPNLIILKKQNLIKWLMPSILFFMAIELIVPFLLLKKDLLWKGQVIKK